MPLSKNDDGGLDNSFVINARIAAGLQRVLRCASTDVLANAIPGTSEDPNQGLGKFDSLILQQAGLVLDLRSPSERNESKASAWMASFQFVVKELPTNQAHSDAELLEVLTSNPRLVVRLDILSPSRFMDYIEQNWLSPEQKLQANLSRTKDDNKLHNLRMEMLNRRGLLGLNEAILESGKQGLCTALKLITLHLEHTKKVQGSDSVDSHSPRRFDLVVIHCVQGKDRTGLLVMLCQALMGVSDEEMIEDYHKSHNLRSRRRYTKGENERNEKTSAAMELATATRSRARNTTSGQLKLDRSMFHGAPRHVMQSTLEYLRSVYGSVVPGYLNHIGFDASWQRRFHSAASSHDKHVRSNHIRSRL